MTSDKHELIPAVETPLAPLESSNQFHGDLRKGAYLRRRADYQLQASAPTVRQAGEDISPVTGGRRPPR
jgi:hypothetical protein